MTQSYTNAKFRLIPDTTYEDSHTIGVDITSGLVENPDNYSVTGFSQNKPLDFMNKGGAPDGYFPDFNTSSLLFTKGMTIYSTNPHASSRSVSIFRQVESRIDYFKSPFGASFAGFGVPYDFPQITNFVKTFAQNQPIALWIRFSGTPIEIPRPSAISSDTATSFINSMTGNSTYVLLSLGLSISNSVNRLMRYKIADGTFEEVYTSATADTNGAMTALCYGQSLFVAAGVNSIRTSPSGDSGTWTTRQTATGVRFIDVYSNNAANLFIAVGINAANNLVVYTSSNGTTWANVTIPAFQNTDAIGTAMQSRRVRIRQTPQGYFVITGTDKVLHTPSPTAASNTWSIIGSTDTTDIVDDILAYTTGTMYFLRGTRQPVLQTTIGNFTPVDFPYTLSTSKFADRYSSPAVMAARAFHKGLTTTNGTTWTQDIYSNIGFDAGTSTEAARRRSFLTRSALCNSNIGGAIYLPGGIVRKDGYPRLRWQIDMGLYQPLIAANFVYKNRAYIVVRQDGSDSCSIREVTNRTTTTVASFSTSSTSSEVLHTFICGDNVGIVTDDFRTYLWNGSSITTHNFQMYSDGTRYYRFSNSAPELSQAFAEVSADLTTWTNIGNFGAGTVIGSNVNLVARPYNGKLYVVMQKKQDYLTPVTLAYQYSDYQTYLYEATGTALTLLTPSSVFDTTVFRQRDEACYLDFCSLGIGIANSAGMFSFYRFSTSAIERIPGTTFLNKCLLRSCVGLVFDPDTYT